MIQKVKYPDLYCPLSIEKHGLFSSPSELYKDLKDFPVFDWWEFNKTGDLQLICKKKGLVRLDLAAAAVDKYRDHFIMTFGLSRESCKYYNLKIQLAKEENKRFLGTPDEMLIEIIKRDIKALIPDKEDVPDNLVITIEKYMGFRVGSDVSVHDYYSYIKFISKNGPKADRK